MWKVNYNFTQAPCFVFSKIYKPTKFRASTIRATVKLVTVKLALCLINPPSWRRTQYWRYSNHLFFTSVLDGSRQYPLNRKLGGTRFSVNHVEKKNFLSLPSIEPLFLDHPARRLLNIPTEPLTSAFDGGEWSYSSPSGGILRTCVHNAGAYYEASRRSCSSSFPVNQRLQVTWRLNTQGEVFKNVQGLYGDWREVIWDGEHVVGHGSFILNLATCDFGYWANLHPVNFHFVFINVRWWYMVCRIFNGNISHCYVVGPCHHGMARPQVADRGTASDKEVSCE